MVIPALLTAWAVPPAPAPAPVTSTAAVTPPSRWRSDPYVRPRVNGQFLSFGGRTVLQALGGVEVGLRYDRADVEERGDRWVRTSPDLLGRTRVIADLLYGIGTDSTGYNVRLGSFLGPTSRGITFQFGPDLWLNQYGAPNALDYHLPASVGLAVMSLVVFDFDPAVQAQLGVTPGWAFTGPRRVRTVGPFHELSAFGLVTVRLQGFVFNVGYQRQYNAAGVFDGLILSGGL
jgi:hypothetical protein